MTITENLTAPQRVSVTALARRPVFAIAGAVGLLLLITSGRYGYFGDELYFLAAGRHLSWGYADQPPVLPLLARAMDAIAPDSVTVLRLPAVLVTVLGVIVAALIARELGGRRKAQVMTAGAFSICGQFLGTGHYQRSRGEEHHAGHADLAGHRPRRAVVGAVAEAPRLRGVTTIMTS